MMSGVNTKLSASAVEAAVKLRVYDLRKSRGLAVPEDRLDFIARSSLHWLADHSAMVTWEE